MLLTTEPCLQPLKNVILNIFIHIKVRFCYYHSVSLYRRIMSCAHTTVVSHRCRVTPLLWPPLHPLPALWYCLSFSCLHGIAFPECLGWTHSVHLWQFAFLYFFTCMEVFSSLWTCSRQSYGNVLSRLRRTSWLFLRSGGYEESCCPFLEHFLCGCIFSSFGRKQEHNG